MNALISRQLAIQFLAVAEETEEMTCKQLRGVFDVLHRVPESMKWIPVSESLPDNEKYDWVLAVMRVKDSGVYLVPRVIEYIESRNDWLFTDDGGWLSNKQGLEVVAWMPLPEPYKEEDA